MENIKYEMDGNTLVLRIRMNKRIGESQSGTPKVASTARFEEIVDGEYIMLLQLLENKRRKGSTKAQSDSEDRPSRSERTARSENVVSKRGRPAKTPVPEPEDEPAPARGRPANKTQRPARGGDKTERSAKRVRADAEPAKRARPGRSASGKKANVVDAMADI